MNRMREHAVAAVVPDQVELCDSLWRRMLAQVAVGPHEYLLASPLVDVASVGFGSHDATVANPGRNIYQYWYIPPIL